MTIEELDALFPHEKMAISRVMDESLRTALAEYMTDERCDLETAVMDFNAGRFGVAAEIEGFGWFEVRPLPDVSGPNSIKAFLVPLDGEPGNCELIDVGGAAGATVPGFTPSARPAPTTWN